MAFPVTLNGTTYTLADFEGLNYVDGFPDALEDFVTEAAAQVTAAETAKNAAEAALDSFDDRFLGSKASDPTLDNDGNALTDGALYFDTTNNVMKVYDLGNTEWKQTTPTTSQQANIDTVAANDANITTVATNDSNITTVAGINSNVTTVAGISANVTTVATNNSNITTVAAADANITTVATNIGDVNSFAEVYRIASSEPSTSLDEGDLYFDTTADKVRVYNGTAWQDVAPTATSITASQISDLTSTAAELNLLDGVTATTAEINHLDGVTSNIQTQIDAIAPGVVSYTAAEAISAGDAVALKSDGKVEKIFGAIQDENLYSAGDEVELIASNAGLQDSPGCFVEIPGTSRAIWIFRDDLNNEVSAQLISVSGTTPTKVGSKTTISSGNTPRDVDAVFDTSTSDTFIVTYSEGANDDGFARVCTISGDTITAGTAANIATEMGVTRAQNMAVSYDVTQDRFLFAARDISDDGDMIVASRSGTTLSFGTKVRYETGVSDGINLVYDESIGAHLLTYYDASTLTAKVVTISGTTPTVQATDTDTSISWGGSGSVEHMPQGVAGDGAGQFVGVYRGRAILFSATSSTVSIDDVEDTPTDTDLGWWSLTYDPFVTTTAGRGAYVMIRYDANGDRAFLDYAFESATDTLSFVSFDNIVDGSSNVIRKGLAIQYITSQGSILAAGQWGNSGAAETMAFALAANFSNVDKFVGFATGAVAADASGDFTIIGGTNDQQSGLTAGSLFYLTGGGSLTTTATDYPVGLARSTTELDVGATAVDYAPATASGTWTKLAEVNASGASNVDVTGDTDGYKMVKVLIAGLKFDSGADIRIQLINSSGSVITSGVHGYAGSYHRHTTQANAANNGRDHWAASLGQQVEHDFSGHIRVSGIASGSKTVGEILIGSGTSTRDAMHFKVGITTSNTDQFGGVRIFNDGPRTLTGTVKMYGLN